MPYSELRKSCVIKGGTMVRRCQGLAVTSRKFFEIRTEYISIGNKGCLDNNVTRVQRNRKIVIEYYRVH